MAKYIFQYDQEHLGRRITHTKDFSAIDSKEEDLDEVLDEFKLFLQAVTYSTAGIVNTDCEDSYLKVYDYAEELKWKNINEEDKASEMRNG